ncbi:hypothetical protein K491DRAFT_712133 [Lophiostoma macrostomum CBS 122681]|uniref:Uncharacterized protein n=1 Tax=Lophiostoma macrostomum CBS 122681 TaxID=1314788 RepID=A0A6A6TKX5_9PLEO|nr:hypothetical protein K491DRAFT_712133 [Lophiostoma macrostomum CBS 122681]
MDERDSRSITPDDPNARHGVMGVVGNIEDVQPHDSIVKPLIPSKDAKFIRIKAIAVAKPGMRFGPEEVDKLKTLQQWNPHMGIPKDLAPEFEGCTDWLVASKDLPEEQRCRCIMENKESCDSGYCYLQEHKDGGPGDKIANCEGVKQCKGHRYNGERRGGNCFEAYYKIGKVKETARLICIAKDEY